MSHPLPLVTITLTTDEIAMAHAGLLLLRKEWANHMLGSETLNPDEAGKIVERCTLMIQRLNEAVTAEQGQALLGELIRDLKRRG